MRRLHLRRRFPDAMGRLDGQLGRTRRISYDCDELPRRRVLSRVDVYSPPPDRGDPQRLRIDVQSIDLQPEVVPPALGVEHRRGR